jgi:hypothetical protein
LTICTDLYNFGTKNYPLQLAIKKVEPPPPPPDPCSGPRDLWATFTDVSFRGELRLNAGGAVEWTIDGDFMRFTVHLYTTNIFRDPATNYWVLDIRVVTTAHYVPGSGSTQDESKDEFWKTIHCRLPDSVPDLFANDLITEIPSNFNINILGVTGILRVHREHE